MVCARYATDLEAGAVSQAYRYRSASRIPVSRRRSKKVAPEKDAQPQVAERRGTQAVTGYPGRSRALLPSANDSLL